MDGYLEIFLKAVIIFCACISIICFVRAVMGPTIPDRILAINMIGTQMIIIIAVLTILLGEAWLADVAAVYALLSFLGVVVLTKIYIGIYRKKHAEMFGDEAENEEAHLNDGAKDR
ncbi:MAG: sodium:proton antiporter [Lachnospiraceae bacterium]|jgi:multicomponent Na+:H+ antiporter subunit F|nr:sodium:proton antiporter [Lachnospiraceae bacterium]MCR4991740.1 sodium:proton antiporter [Lachnospiraceae bacterium]